MSTISVCQGDVLISHDGDIVGVSEPATVSEEEVAHHIPWTVVAKFRKWIVERLQADRLLEFLDSDDPDIGPDKLQLADLYLFRATAQVGLYFAPFNPRTYTAFTKAVGLGQIQEQYIEALFWLMFGKEFREEPAADIKE